MTFEEDTAFRPAAEEQDAITPPAGAGDNAAEDASGEDFSDPSGEFAAWMAADALSGFADLSEEDDGDESGSASALEPDFGTLSASGGRDDPYAPDARAVVLPGREFSADEREEQGPDGPGGPDGPDGPDGPSDDDEPHEPCLLGVRLRKAGQVFFFPDNGLRVRVGGKIVVQLEQGPALGEVESLLPLSMAGAVDPEQARGEALRPATAKDIAQHTENSILAAEASAFCKTCIRQRNLDMKLVDVEVMHDRSKIIFFFTAPSRIDFRELVKDLVRNYRTRIELRQIGVRHETQMIGAIGNCGMVCCCHRYLRKFAPVTIKMAKEQNLFLNPSKLSGMCGRLLCCLSFEQGNYEEFNRRCPKLGKRYATARGLFRVLRANMFSRSIVLLNENNEEVEMTLEDWDALDARRADPGPQEQQKGAPRHEQGRRERPRKRGPRHAPHREEPEKE